MLCGLDNALTLPARRHRLSAVQGPGRCPLPAPLRGAGVWRLCCGHRPCPRGHRLTVGHGASAELPTPSAKRRQMRGGSQRVPRARGEPRKPFFSWQWSPERGSISAPQGTVLHPPSWTGSRGSPWPGSAERAALVSSLPGLVWSSARWQNLLLCWAHPAA